MTPRRTRGGRRGVTSEKEHRGLLRDGVLQPKGEGRVCGKCGRPSGLREDVPGEVSCIYCGHLEFR